MPASTKSVRIRAAAIRLPTKPVRDRVRGQARLDQTVARDQAHLRGGERPGAPVAPRAPGALVEAVAHAETLAVRQAQASGRARAKAQEAAEADAAATTAPSAASIQKWLAVAITTNVTSAG